MTDEDLSWMEDEDYNWMNDEDLKAFVYAYKAEQDRASKIPIEKCRINTENWTAMLEVQDWLQQYASAHPQCELKIEPIQVYPQHGYASLQFTGQAFILDNAEWRNWLAELLHKAACMFALTSPDDATNADRGIVGSINIRDVYRVEA